MMRDEGRSGSSGWNVTTIAWGHAGVFLLVSLLFAAKAPLALLAPLGAAAVVAVPRLRAGRTPVFVGIGAVWLATLVPALSIGTNGSATLFFGAAALLAAEVARGEGVGRKIGRGLRTPRVQGILELAVCVPLSAGWVYEFDATLRTSPLPPAWRLLIVPLAGFILTPGAGPFNFGRIIPAGIAVAVAFVAADGDPRDPVAAVAYEAAMLALRALVFAAFAHEGWAKIRPRRSDDGLGSRPIRVSSGSGIV